MRRVPSVIVPGEYGRGPDRGPEHRPVVTTGAARPPGARGWGRYHPADHVGACLV